jgi:hypothetical protein
VLTGLSPEQGDEVEIELYDVCSHLCWSLSSLDIRGMLRGGEKARTDVDKKWGLEKSQ